MWLFPKKTYPIWNSLCLFTFKYKMLYTIKHVHCDFSTQLCINGANINSSLTLTVLLFFHNHFYFSCGYLHWYQSQRVIRIVLRRCIVQYCKFCHDGNWWSISMVYLVWYFDLAVIGILIAHLAIIRLIIIQPYHAWHLKVNGSRLTCGDINCNNFHFTLFLQSKYSVIVKLLRI